MSNFTEEGYLSREAAADLSAKKYYIVKTDANGKIVLAAAATDAILGVLANEPVLGETASVDLINRDGTGKVIAGGSIAKDAYLTTDSAGKAVTATQAVAGAQPTTQIIGRALAAAASGDVLEYIKLNGKY